MRQRYFSLANHVPDQRTFQMNTLFNQLGFLSLLTAVLVGFSACGSHDVAQTSILVLQKQPVSTGLQPIPVEGASVRLYVNKPSNFVEVRLFTDKTPDTSHLSTFFL